MKNKYLRLLIVAILCFTLAFSAIGITACKKDDNNGGGNTDPVTYTVTFDSDGGSAVNSKTVNENEKVAKPDDPAKTGYDFVAWELNGVAYDFNSPVTGNITLKATWTVHYSTVKAMLDDTVVYDIQYVAYGEKATKVAKDPAASGKVFDKWMLDEVAYNFDTAVTSDITLTASWTNKDYGSVEVSFETNGGSAVPTQTITTGSYATLPQNPTREDVEFAGWYKDEDLTEEFDIENTAIKSNITLYAKWTLKSGDTAVTEDTTWSFKSGDTASDNYFVFTNTDTETDFNNLSIGSNVNGGTYRDNNGQSYQIPEGLTYTFFVDGACTVSVSAHGSNGTYAYYSISHDGVTDNAPQGSDQPSTFSVDVKQASKIVIESTNNDCYLTAIKVTYPVEQEPISVNTTWSFISTDTAADNFYVAASDFVVQNKVDTFEGLLIDASTGKLAKNNDNWFQFNNTTAISFKVTSDATVKVQGYDNNYTVNGVAANGTAQQLQSFEVSAGKVTIVATANNYIGKIVVEFHEVSGDIPDGYELVESTCPIDTLADLYKDNTVFGSDVTYGNFTLGQGTKVEKSKGAINTQGKVVYVTVNGINDSNSISFKVENGASSNFTGLTVTNAKGEPLASCGNETKEFSLTNLPAGRYTLTSNGGACRIYNLKTSEVLEQGVPVSMKANPVTVDFLAGATPTAAGVTASVTYANGSIKTKTVLETDVSSVKTDRAGEYIVRVFYTESDETVTATYSVFVYDLDSVALYTSTTSGTTQTNLQTVYMQNGTLSTAGLTVKAVGVLGNKTKEFIMTSNEYTLSTVDLTTLGEKVVTVTCKANGNIAASFNIFVVAKAEAANNTVTVTVDPSQPVSGTNFHTVNQALSYFTSANYGDSVVKVINIADGEYYEKISIKIPNVQLIGSATATPDATTNNGVVLYFDACNGKTDAIGTAYGTNGSASVSVIAANFVAKNITFKNYYNTNALYNESKDLVGSGTQAVALYVDSTSACFYNCKMTGYHDTLYANKGNQYYYQCWIEGRTDFIFGSDAHAYFYQCTINTVSAGSEDGNGGYVVAYQNTSASFGPIFNECNFTGAESGATNIALGRAWGKEFHMVVINSSISANYSTAAHTAQTTKGERYVTMSGNEPKPENMIEANNTGAGRISESLANTCTVDPTATTTYGIDNLSSILGFTPAAE